MEKTLNVKTNTLDIGGKVLDIVDYIEIADNTISTEQYYVDIEREILNSSFLTEAQKDAYCESLYLDKTLNGICIVGKWWGAAVAKLGDEATKSKILAPLGYALKLEVLLCNFIFDTLQYDALIRQNNHMYEIQNMKFNYRWAIDPSGYVFDLVTNERIQGVKATLYYKEALENNAILWDASEYSQINPLYTDKDGKYAWDVPEGFWQVKYEHELYETTYSEWLEVPPPQTEVNVGMKPLYSSSKNVNYDNSNKTVTIISNQAYSDAEIIVALYDSDDKFISLESQSADIKSGITEIEFIDFASDNGDIVKVMVWESMKNLNPIFDICSVEI